MILGLDLGAHWGYAVVRADGTRITSGHRHLTGTTLGHRNVQLSLSLNDLVDEFAPEWLVIAKPTHHGARTSILVARSLYNYAGKAEECAYMHDIGYLEIPETTVRLHAVGSGAAKKDEVARILAPLCDPGASLDETDALAVAIAASRMPRRQGAVKPARRKRAA